MRCLGILSSLMLLFLQVGLAEGHDFRSPEEPGYRISLGDEETGEQMEQDFTYLNCAMREYLNYDYVEACAIFKEGGRRYLDCRHLPGTYEDIPSEILSGDRDRVTNLCSKEIFAESESGGGFADLWSRLFGD